MSSSIDDLQSQIKALLNEPVEELSVEELSVDASSDHEDDGKDHVTSAAAPIHPRSTNLPLTNSKHQALSILDQIGDNSSEYDPKARDHIGTMLAQFLDSPETHPSSTEHRISVQSRSETLQLVQIAQRLVQKVDHLKNKNKDLINRVLTSEPNYQEQKKRIQEKFEEYSREQDLKFQMLELKYTGDLSQIKLENESLKKINEELLQKNAELEKLVRRLTNENNYLKKQLAALTKKSNDTNSRLNNTIKLLAQTESKHQQEINDVRHRLDVMTKDKDDVDFMNSLTDVYRYVRDYEMLLARRGDESRFFKNGSDIIKMLDRIDATLNEDEKREKTIAVDIVEKRLSLSADTLINLYHKNDGRNTNVHFMDRRKFGDSAYVLEKLKELQTALNKDVKPHHAIYPDLKAITTMITTLVKRLESPV